MSYKVNENTLDLTDHYLTFAKCPAYLFYFIFKLSPPVVLSPTTSCFSISQVHTRG